ncbi:unnamed protein product, partial [Didymodactylos carnosus]
MATGGDNGRSRRNMIPRNVYSPDESFYCVMDVLNPNKYHCIDKDLILKQSGKKVIVRDGDKILEFVLIAKAADLTRMSSQSEEENQEPENDDGYSGGTRRESQVATASRITTTNNFVAQPTGKRSSVFDLSGEEEEDENGSVHFARMGTQRKTVRRRSLPPTQDLDESRSSKNSATSAISNNSVYTTPVPNNVLKDLTESIKGQIADLTDKVVSAAKQTRNLVNIYDGQNLLLIPGLSPAEFGRNVLSTLFADNELATHTMPSLHRHKRRPTDPPTLDADKIDILK